MLPTETPFCNTAGCVTSFSNLSFFTSLQPSDLLPHSHRLHWCGEQKSEGHRWQEGHSGSSGCREEVFSLPPSLQTHGWSHGNPIPAESSEPGTVHSQELLPMVSLAVKHTQANNGACTPKAEHWFILSVVGLWCSTLSKCKVFLAKLKDTFWILVISVPSSIYVILVVISHLLRLSIFHTAAIYCCYLLCSLEILSEMERISFLFLLIQIFIFKLEFPTKLCFVETFLLEPHEWFWLLPPCLFTLFCLTKGFTTTLGVNGMLIWRQSSLYPHVKSKC